MPSIAMRCWPSHCFSTMRSSSGGRFCAATWNVISLSELENGAMVMGTALKNRRQDMDRETIYLTTRMFKRIVGMIFVTARGLQSGS